MTQDRLDALMLASAKDILLNSDELVASFAGQTERRILLA
jgi:hypothetical protein